MRVTQEDVDRTELTTEEATELPEAGKFLCVFKIGISLYGLRHTPDISALRIHFAICH